MGHVSAIVCVHNEIEMLPGLLRHLDGIPAVGEIIAMDSGSTDGTLETLIRYRGPKRLRLAQHGIRSFSEQRNLAASLATLDWLLVIDADERYTRPVSDLLDALPALPKVNAVRLLTLTSYPDWNHVVEVKPDDPHCRIIRRGFVTWGREVHDIPTDVNGRDLHTAVGDDVILCWESDWKECVLLHGQLIKSAAALEAKSQRWEQLGWFERQEGTTVKPGHWAALKAKAAELTVVPLDEQMRPSYA